MLGDLLFWPPIQTVSSPWGADKSWSLVSMCIPGGPKLTAPYYFLVSLVLTSGGQAGPQVFGAPGIHDSGAGTLAHTPKPVASAHPTRKVIIQPPKTAGKGL